MIDELLSDPAFLESLIGQEVNLEEREEDGPRGSVGNGTVPSGGQSDLARAGEGNPAPKSSEYASATMQVVGELQDSVKGILAKVSAAFESAGAQNNIYAGREPLNRAVVYAANGVSGRLVTPFGVRPFLFFLSFQSTLVAPKYLSERIPASDHSCSRELGNLKNAFEADRKTLLAALVGQVSTWPTALKWIPKLSRQWWTTRLSRQLQERASCFWQPAMQQGVWGRVVHEMRSRSTSVAVLSSSSRYFLWDATQIHRLNGSMWVINYWYFPIADTKRTTVQLC